MPQLTSTNESVNRAGLFAALLAYTIWGLIPLYWNLLNGVGPVEILAHRIFWSFLFIMATVAVMGRVKNILPTIRFLCENRVQGLCIVLATLFASANWLINIVGVNTGRVVELGIGLFLTPLATIALGCIFYSEKLTKLRAAALFLAAAGVGIMIYKLGDIPWIAIGVSSTWAIYGALKKKVVIDPWMSNAIEHGALVIPAGLFLLYLASDGTGQFLNGPAEVSLVLAGTGVVTAVPMIAFSLAAQRLKLTLLGIIQYLNPVLTLALGVFFFGEPVRESEIVPLCFIWTGVILYLLPSVISLIRQCKDTH